MLSKYYSFLGCVLFLALGGCGPATEEDVPDPGAPPTGSPPPAGSQPLAITAPPANQAEALAPLTVVNLGQATTSGGSGSVAVSNDAPAAGFAVGAHTVSWTATDAAGAQATAMQAVSVLDTTAPSITPPNGVRVAASGAQTAVVLGQAVANDLVDGALIASNDAPAGGFAVGTHTVTWQATDSASNSATATQTVTIDPPMNVVGNPVAGAARYAQDCAGCHGADPTANLANILNGDTPAAIVSAIQTEPAMAPLAATANDAQAVADLAAYLAEQKALAPLVGNVDAGRTAYQQNCGGCHGDDLSLNRNNILNGDTVPAIENALMTEPTMAPLAGLLSQPQTLADLAAFIAFEKANAPAGGIGLIPAPESCAATPVAPIDTVVRRLTRFEYQNTVGDLLGVDISDQMELLPIETRPAGFSNDALSLIVTFEHIDGYNDLATIIKDRIGNPNGFVSGYADCTDANNNCYDSFIANFGERMYRAPVGTLETTELRALFAAAVAEGDGFTEGALLVVRAMLQSPRFLYRTELQAAGAADIRALNSYEIAARLSYLIWASAPDEALLSSARDDALQSPAEILAATNRLLGDPRARRVTEQLVREWFDLDLVATLDRNAADHPDFSVDIATDMQAEAMTLFEQIIWDQQAPLITAYNSSTTYVTQRLADYYGLGAPVGSLGGGVDVYSLDAASERSGLLTQGAVVAVSGGRDASLVHRGLFVLNRVMCSSVQQPPAGIDTTPPAVLPGAPSRSHAEARMANPVCGACHTQIDPLGFAFERFDAAAKNRVADDQGNTLSGVGTYDEPGIGPVAFADAQSFGDAMVASPTAQDCIVVRPAQFAFGRALEPASQDDGCFLSDIRSRAEGSTASYHDLIRAIVSSDAFSIISAE